MTLETPLPNYLAKDVAMSAITSCLSVYVMHHLFKFMSILVDVEKNYVLECEH